MSGFSCQAQQRGDQKSCARCGYTWDMNDPEPPECLPLDTAKKKRGLEVFAQIKRTLEERHKL